MINTISDECKCGRGFNKIVNPKIISKTRIIYRCYVCNGIVAYSDAINNHEIKMVNKYRAILKELPDEILKKWI